MSERDLIVTIVAGVVCASVAYLLGRRQRTLAENAESREAAEAIPASATVASPSGSPKKKSRGKDASPSSAASGASAASSATETEPKESDARERLYDEDEEVDPTRVGDLSKTKKRHVYQPPLRHIVYDEGADREEPTRSEGLFLVHAKAQTDVGLRRKRNEDSLLVDERENLFVVADGMGGYKGGDMASQLAVKAIGMAYETSTFEGPPHEGVSLEATNLARAIQMSNADILEMTKVQPELKGMGTTVCAARFAPNKNRLFIGHVGDSRCYRLRNRVLEQLTADHTMAEEGITGPEGAKLSRAVGVWSTVPIDVSIVAPLPNDDYLLCSDGLTKMVPDAQISEILCTEKEPTAAVDRLIAYANANGGRDNISVILIRVLAPDARATAPEA